MTTESDRERGRRGEDDREQRDQREHRERADQQRLPAQDEAGPTGRKTAQDLVGLLAQDVRVVEGTTEFEEGQVEGDRHGDQQDGGGDVSAHWYFAGGGVLIVPNRSPSASGSGVRFDLSGP